MEHPLDDVVVLDLGQIYLGGYAGLLLTHLGADVIKIEPPWGDNVRARTADGQSPQFQFLNANKRSVTIDLKTSEGQTVLKDLARNADLLIENYARGIMDRLGVGYDTLSEINPRLVYAHGSGYGDYGPYADYPAMDLTIQGMAGVMHTTGYPDQPPVKAGPAVCDFLGGTHLVAAAVSALYMREFTGEGRYIDVAMLDCTFPTLASPVASWALERDAPPRTGNQHSALDIAPYNCYETADGYVILICISERHWENLCRVMDREDLLKDDAYATKASRAEHRETIDAIVQDWIGEQSRDQVVDTLLENNIPGGPVQTVEEVLRDPQLDARGMLNYVPNQSNEGRPELPVPGNPLKVAGTPDPEITPAPRLGTHTEEVLSELAGYSPDQIEALQEHDIV